MQSFSYSFGMIHSDLNEYDLYSSTVLEFTISFTISKNSLATSQQ